MFKWHLNNGIFDIQKGWTLGLSGVPMHTVDYLPGISWLGADRRKGEDRATLSIFVWRRRSQRKPVDIHGRRVYHQFWSPCGEVIWRHSWWRHFRHSWWRHSVVDSSDVKLDERSSSSVHCGWVDAKVCRRSCDVVDVWWVDSPSAKVVIVKVAG